MTRIDHTKRLTKLLSALLALAMVAAACGSSDDAADTTTAAATAVPEATAEPAPEPTEVPEPEESMEEEPEEAMETTEEEPEEEPEEVTEEEPEAASTEASGDPILVGHVGTSVTAGPAAWDAMMAGFDAAEIKINSEGGINGRPIQVLRCDDGGDVNAAADCADQLIDDGVVTFVSNFTFSGGAVNPIIADSGRAVIGGGIFGADDINETVYGTNGGFVTAGAGGAAACVALGSARFVQTYADAPAGAQLIPLVDGLLFAPNPDSEMVLAEPIPLDAADFAPSAAKVAAAEPDCVTIGALPHQTVPLIVALRDAGYDGQVNFSGTFVSTEEIFAALGDNADNVFLPLLYDPRSDGWAEYVAGAQAVTGSDAVPLEIGVMAWLGAVIAADVISEAGEDPEAITAAIPQVVSGGYDTMGLTSGGTLDWSVPGVNPLGLVNVRDVDIIIAEIVDGEPVVDGDWVNMFGL